MGKNSRLKKDRGIIREKTNQLFQNAIDAKNEDEFFEKLTIVQNFDYLIQNDSKTKNKFIHKMIFDRIQELVVEKVINPGVEENKKKFEKFYNDKEIPEGLSLKNLALFAVYLKDKVYDIRNQENYKEITEKLNNKEIVDNILRIKKQQKEIKELNDEDKKAIYDYVAEVNKVMEIVNDEIIEIGDKVVKASEKFKETEKDLDFAGVIYSSYIVAYNNNCFIPAVKEIEQYNNVLKMLKFDEEGNEEKANG